MKSMVKSAEIIRQVVALMFDDSGKSPREMMFREYPYLLWR